MTSTDTQTLRDDVAFLRNLVQGGAAWTGGFGEGYFASGLIYGVQMLLSAGQVLGVVPSSGLLPLVVGIGPTLVFLPTIVWINWRHRRSGPIAPAGRAVTAVFATVGLANIALIAVIGSVAWREQSLTTWLIYPCTVFILQGAAWFVAYAIRRKGWFALVAGAWFVFAIAMAFNVTAIGYYILYAGVGIWACMALPGWVMMRSAPRAAVDA